ncbi:hypothetical protein [Halorientalis persicus]|jgi:hypothetical protein|uniref:hypothetical protein n=1 Tax=Halorientalis persicus TaxID=1367881 RepID=UPI001113D976|nr:hypothetical protein [Halorientalis persicus]
MALEQRDGSKNKKLSKYTLPNETVKTVVAGAGRLFAVTDRRVLNVKKGSTSAGREIEEVESTLFNDVSKVNVVAKGDTGTFDMTKLIAGILAILVGLFMFVVANDAYGTEQGLLFLIAISFLLLGAYLLYNAKTTSPGDIVITFEYVGEDGFIADSYILPADQTDTAHEVVRAVGEPNAD